MSRDDLEPIPYETFQNLQFPGGDIPKSDKATLLLSELSSGDLGERLEKLRSMRNVEILAWMVQPSQEAVRGDFKLLHEGWGRVMDDHNLGTTLGEVGTFSTLAFIRKNRMLPTTLDNFYEEMWTMSVYTQEGIDYFANESWSIMEKTHPNVFNALHPLLKHLENVYQVSEYDVRARSLLAASAVLPYLMISTTRMTGYLNRSLENFSWYMVEERKQNS